MGLSTEELRSQIEDKINEFTLLLKNLDEDDKPSFAPKKLTDIKDQQTQLVCLDFLPFIVGGYNIVAGSGGVGKSMIALRSAIHYLRANTDKRALMIFGEDSKNEVAGRFKYLLEGVFLGLDKEDLLDRMDFITTSNNVAMRFVEKKNNTATINRKLLKDFESYVKVNNIGFVVLDPLKKFHSVNENDNSEMDILVRDIFLDTASKLQIALVLLHHTAKSSSGARGASTITDTARIAYKLSKKLIRDKETGELIEDENYIGTIKVNTIKDNGNIFIKHGFQNTNNGLIDVFPKSRNMHTVIEFHEKDSKIDIPII